jgi:glyoxylase-like metal-dependent hydrolase (beta-lactamase superfamily II)
MCERTAAAEYYFCVLLIPAGNPSPWTGPDGNNTYLLPGAVPTLIDAGVGEAAHLGAVARALGESPLTQVLITHSHPDHAGGIPALLERWPAATIRNVAPDSCRDGELVAAGDTVLTALHTPGHAPDHFCFLDHATGEIYCGDLARLGGTIVIPASKGGNLREYLASLRRIRDLSPPRLWPGHGPAIENVAALIDEYLAHRADRERQIVDALASGPQTVDQLVERIYRGLHPSVVRAAADSVLAHLIKLRDQRRASESGGRWAVVRSP